MNNMNETQGISILSTSPVQFETDIDVYSDIKVTFSGEIDTGTLKSSIIVLKDKDGIYENPASLKYKDKFIAVKGSIKYSDRILTFTPSRPYDIDTRYVVVINNTIKDITGLPLLKKKIFSFNTEITKSYGKTEILQPKYGSISRDIPEIHWKSQEAPCYIMQVSKSPGFETIVYENFIVPDEEHTYISQEEYEFQPEEVPPEEQPFNVNFYIPEFNKKEGVYYLRIKAEGGKWSDIWQFFIKETTDAVIAEDDEKDIQYLDDFLSDVDKEITVLEYFPPDGSISNSLKTNIFYIKMDGKVDESEVEYPELSVYGEAADEKDEEEGYKHGILKGAWTFVYDEDHDCTYLIFTPDSEQEERKVIVTADGRAISPEEGAE